DFEHFSNLLDHGYPIVFFDRVPDIPKAINVMVDDYRGAYDAVSHLIRQGYKQIVHLAGPKNLAISKERIRGYKDALNDHGMKVHESLIVECPLGTDDESRKITAEILRNSEQKPDAFFGNNDMAAVGAMMACRDAGLKVPEDVGVVGFSNWQFCSMIDPGLSSVAQPGFQMGAKATEILLDIIEKKLDPDQITEPITLPTELLVRKSSVRTKS
ncbi:MAG: substrate-binding domain-containing protein, partial [Cyclobacteriaceae bacterium]|nr:substrate-binding domain-containing protein [Cyclobacteriaceae bacterium]